MYKQAYPIFLNTQSADTIDSSNGLFEWVLDRSILPTNNSVADLEIQVHSLQMSRQFENTSNGGNVLTFTFSHQTTIFYTITIPERYYSNIDEVITAFNNEPSARRITGSSLVIDRPISLFNGNRTDRLISVFSPTNSTMVIENTGLALRIGISNERFLVPPSATNSGNSATMNGTFDLNFPKMVYITAENSLDVDMSLDSTPTASKKILCGLPINCAYGEFIPFIEPFVRLPLANQSINKITLKLVDELFNPIQMYNAFSITLMLYK